MPPAAVLPGDTLAILHESLAGGIAKGVCCPQAQYFWWAAHTAALLGLGEGERLLTTLPLFHTNALNAFYQALLTGSTLIVEKRFSVSDFLPSLKRAEATTTYLLGAMVPMLLSRPESPEERAHGVRVALAPGESKDMGVVFFVDPDMLKDPDTSEIHTITLSYSMFKAANQQTERRKTDKLGPNS